MDGDVEYSRCSDCEHYYDDDESTCEVCIHNYTERFKSITIKERIKHLRTYELAALLVKFSEFTVVSVEHVIKWLNTPAPHYDNIDDWFLEFSKKKPVKARPNKFTKSAKKAGKIRKKKRRR